MKVKLFLPTMYVVQEMEMLPRVCLSVQRGLSHDALGQAGSKWEGGPGPKKRLARKEQTERIGQKEGPSSTHPMAKDR